MMENTVKQAGPLEMALRRQEELCHKEHTTLREELHNLKKCQVQFLTFAVTATGAILGIGAKIGQNHPVSMDTFYLFPLIILIPAWWIFFDKATTITRIVGYYRVLEQAILRPHSVKGFIGWERALVESREKQRKHYKPEHYKPEDRILGFFKMLVLLTTQRYWSLTYYTFCVLSVLCILGSIFSPPAPQDILAVFAKIQDNTHLFIAALAVAISSVYNIRVVWMLSWGKRSYEYNEQIWRDVLRAEKESDNTEQ